MMNRAATAALALSVVALAITLRPAEAQQQGGARVPRAVLERYAGEYVYPDGATFTVGLDGDTLVQVLPQRRLAYTSLSETLFMLGPVFTAEFVFEAGGMTQILGSGFQQMLARLTSKRE